MAGAHAVLDLRDVDVGLGHGDGGADVVALGEVLVEHSSALVAIRVHGHDLGGVGPGRVRADLHGRRRHLQLRHVVRVQGARGHGQTAVDAVAAAVRADAVACTEVPVGGQDGATLVRRRRAPVHLDGLHARPPGVRGQRHVRRQLAGAGATEARRVFHATLRAPHLVGHGASHAFGLLRRRLALLARNSRHGDDPTRTNSRDHAVQRSATTRLRALVSRAVPAILGAATFSG